MHCKFYAKVALNFQITQTNKKFGSVHDKN